MKRFNEIEDLSPIQFQVLKDLFPNLTKELLGSCNEMYISQGSSQSLLDLEAVFICLDEQVRIVYRYVPYMCRWSWADASSLHPSLLAV